jgi:hypothetical protein
MVLRYEEERKQENSQQRKRLLQHIVSKVQKKKGKLFVSR